MNAPATPRTIVLHYHLFKNAGTSVDQVLKKNFGDRWVTREFEPRGNQNLHRKDVTDWILAHPQAVAFSSHTMELPPPVIDGVRIIPVIFIRHPLDRIASAYAFERRQGGEGFGSVLARHTSMAGYIEVRLALGRDRQCRNFHVERYAPMFPADTGHDVERAIRTVESLPFVGVVEEFETSMRLLSDLLLPSFPGFAAPTVRANASRDSDSSLSERLAEIESEIGTELYLRLLKMNEADLGLHRQASDKLKSAVST